MAQALRPARAALTSWLIGAALAALGAWHAVIDPLSPLRRLELAADDLGQQLDLAWRKPAGPHPDIAIVDIDEPSLQAIGHWPWGRHELAALTRELTGRQQVAGLAFDLVFPEPADQDAEFAAALQAAPAVLGFYLSADRGGHRVGQLPAPLFAQAAAAAPPGLPRWTGYGANLPALAAAAPRAGFFNVLPDVDGVTRSVPAVALLDGQAYPTLALALLRLATGEPALRGEWQADGQLSALLLALPGEPLRRLPLDEHGGLRIPFRAPGVGPGGPGLAGDRGFRYVSAGDLLAGRLAASSLRGQLVLVGSSAPGLADLRATPVHPAMPGVEIHAQLLAGLLDGRLPYRPAWAPGYETTLIVLALALAGWAASRPSAGQALAGALILLAALFAAQLGLRLGAGLLLPVASPALLAGVFFLGLLGRNYLREARQRGAMEALFQQYLPPERARQLARQPGNAGIDAQNVELTVLFCDLRGFSALAEALPPLALRDLLNLYFSTATRVIHAHDGTLDKFIGDAVMAFWGAPQTQVDHARRAVQAGLALIAAGEPLNRELQAHGLPAIHYGIGLATGVVCVGDLGSKLRRSYTAVGDAVNIAARLEATTREAGVDLLVDESTRVACGDSLPGVDWQPIGDCPVRGRQQSVMVFTPRIKPA